MIEKEIFPLDKSAQFTFICPYCNRLQHSKVFNIPVPNYFSRSVVKSIVFKYYEAECKNPLCGQLFDVFISNSMAGGILKITDLDDDDIIKLSVN